MNQVIFANKTTNVDFIPFDINFSPVSLMAWGAETDEYINDHPNEDFVIHYMTPSKTFKTIEVNRETLNIQKVNQFDADLGGEYNYTIDNIFNASNTEPVAIQVIRQDGVPHQRNSWYIELDVNNLGTSFFNQLKVLSKSDLLGITNLDSSEQSITSKYPLTFKAINCEVTVTPEIIKSPYQYLQMLLTKHVQNFGYNHTDDNVELNSGLADYKAWIAGTEKDSTVAVYRLRFATNRKASKTRDERVWQNVYICTKGQNNSVATLLDAYIAILNGEETEGGE